MRIVFDTNVLIAAFISQGHCSNIYQPACIDHTLLVSEFILNEVQVNLVKKFRYPKSEATTVTTFIRNHSHVSTTVPTLSKQVCRDVNDDAILALAVYQKASAIFSGDNDLLVLKKFQHIPILLPNKFWAFTI